MSGVWLADAAPALGDGGQVGTLLDPPGGIAARLRYLLRLTGYTSLELDAAARLASLTAAGESWGMPGTASSSARPITPRPTLRAAFASPASSGTG